MMQEISNDSNGEGAYDFVSDAKKDSAPSAGGSASIPSSMTSSTSSTFSSSPFHPSPGPLTNPLAPGQRPTYAYPPGYGPSAPSMPRAPSSGPVYAAPPGFTNYAAPSVSSAKPFTPLPPTSSSDTLTDISHTLKSSTISSGRSAPLGNTGGQPDLTEVFGTDVMAQLPPLQSNRPFQPVSFGSPPATTTSTPSILSQPPGPPRSTVGPPPLPPSLASSVMATGGVNPFSSQAAAGHLPSFSALGPLPSHTLPSQGQQTIPLPQGSSVFGPPGSTPQNPPPVTMMSVPASGQSLPGPGLGPGFPPPLVQTDLSQQYQSVSSIPSDQQAYGQGNQFPGSTVSYDYGATSSGYPNQYSAGQPASYGQTTGYDMGQEHSAQRPAMGGWMQSSFDALKNVTEKAKSTAFSLMNTLDPQMKQYATPGTDPSAMTGGELTLFYIGNDASLMDAVKSGAEYSYKSVHIYTRSGTAPGHKQQIGFVNALNVASATINLARSAPQLQNSLLLAVEPFAVELVPGFWYAGACLVLSDPMTANGDLLHTFSQLTLLTDFSLHLAAPGDQQLIAPLDDLISERSALLLPRDRWMDQLTGLSFPSTVAFACRQLIGPLNETNIFIKDGPDEG